MNGLCRIPCVVLYGIIRDFNREVYNLKTKYSHHIWDFCFERRCTTIGGRLGSSGLYMHVEWWLTYSTMVVGRDLRLLNEKRNFNLKG